jgi:hypothetical protein
VVSAWRRPEWKPFGRALLAGLATSLLLLGWTGKAVFPHYVQPLLPFLFAAFAALPCRLWVVLLIASYCAGAADIYTAVAWHVHDKSSLAVQRAVIDRLRNQPQVQLAFSFSGYPLTYEVLSNLEYAGRTQFGELGPIFVLMETDRHPVRSHVAADLGTLGVVDLEAVETIGPVTLYRAARQH